MPGSKEFGAGPTNIKIDSTINEDIQISENKIKVKQKLANSLLENSDQSIDITVTTCLVNINAVRKIEWKTKIDDFSPLALVFRDNEQIASTNNNSYTDTDKLDESSVTYQIEIADKSGKKIRSYPIKYTIPTISYYFLIDSSNSMWASCRSQSDDHFFTMSKKYVLKKFESLLRQDNDKINVYSAYMNTEMNELFHLRSTTEAKLFLNQIKHPGGKTIIGAYIEVIRKRILENINSSQYIEIYFFSDMEESKPVDIPLKMAIKNLNNSLLKLKNTELTVYIYSCRALDKTIMGMFNNSSINSQSLSF